MSESILKKTISLMLDGNSSCANFIWHGGEPLLMGVRFFEKVLDIQNSLNQSNIELTNCIQTNGLLLDNEWIQFIKDNNFRLSISLDGPENLHCTARGVPSSVYESIRNNVKSAVDSGIKPSVLCVVKNESLGKEKEIFDSFVELGIKHFGFLPMNYGDLGDCVDPVVYGKFMINMFDIWANGDDDTIQIREFEDILRGFLGKGQTLCTRCNLCHYYFTITPNGNVFPCDSYPQKSSFCFGGVDNSYEDLISHSSKFFANASSLPDDCKKCDFRDICNGGCKHHRWIVDKEYSKKHFYCESDKMLLEHIRCNIFE